MLNFSGFKQTLNIVSRAYGRYKWYLAVLVALGFFSSLLESISIAALIPLFSILVGEGGGSTDIFSRYFAAGLSYFSLRMSISVVLSFMVGLFFFRAGSMLLFTYFRTKIVVDYQVRTMREFLSRILSASWLFLTRQKLGYLQSNFTRDIERGVGLFMSVAQAITALTALLMYLLVALTISPFVTLITLTAGILVMVALRPLVKSANLAARRMNFIEKDTTQLLTEHVIGMKTVRSSGVGDRVLGKGKELLEGLRRIKIKNAMLRSSGITFMQPLSLVFIAGLFLFTYREPGFNLAAFIATVYLIQKIFFQVETAQRILHSQGELIPYVEDALQMSEALKENEEKNMGKESFKFSDTLVLKDIHFSFTENVRVLDGLSLEIKKGETAGLIGLSGAGKTSLADILLRLLEPQGGKVLIDGRDIKEIKIDEWRTRVGYVSQDIFLLNDTLKNNIKFYEDRITDEDITAVARSANIYDFISSLPEGFETVVGERGVMLSAGQRQRVVLARVLARRPEILILDEATSALDNESELLVQKAINVLKGKITVLIIAHRLSTVADVDKILVLDRGKIVEEGRPEELLWNPNSYFYRVSHLKENRKSLDEIGK